jgi:hypothetical protein
VSFGTPAHQKQKQHPRQPCGLEEAIDPITKWYLYPPPLFAFRQKKSLLQKICYNTFRLPNISDANIPHVVLQVGLSFAVPCGGGERGRGAQALSVAADGL